MLIASVLIARFAAGYAARWLLPACGPVSRGIVAAWAGRCDSAAVSSVERGSGTKPLGAACLPLDRHRPSERNGRLLDTENAM